jgi:hypothetical protein
MKKLVAILVLISFSLTLKADQTTDSILKIHKAEIENVKKNTGEIRKDVDTIKAAVSVLKVAKVDRDIKFIEWILVFSPLWIFCISLVVIRKKLKGFKLRDALTEVEKPKITIPNVEYTAANLNTLAANNNLVAGVLTSIIPPTIEVTANTGSPESSSRYIALITSTLAWIIVLTLSCFFLYQYVKTNEPPNLSGLSTLMLTLGVGVVPYAFNKVSTALEK